MAPITKADELKKILGIIASPRRSGNCEILVKEIARHIPERHELQLLRLSDFHIKPCRGCYLCLFKKERCILKDDLPPILDAIIETDAFILAAPTYFLGVNSSLKRLLDRGLSFYAHAEKIWGKPAVGIGTAGIRGKEGYTLLAIESFLNIILSDIKYCAMIYGALPGEILLNDKNRKIASDLGTALFGQPKKSAAPSCPLCGGNAFRFLENSEVRCMLCSNAGTFKIEAGEITFQIKKNAHGLFLSKDEALEHRQWLRDEVKRFREQRELLKKLSLPYQKEGHWIKP